jgi:hypothetical protein
MIWLELAGAFFVGVFVGITVICWGFVRKLNEQGAPNPGVDGPSKSLRKP